MLDAAGILNIAQGHPKDCNCVLKVCRGWESVPGERWPSDLMQPAGSLQPPMTEGQTELTFEEFHTEGTRYESTNAPIAPGYFPFNRCDIFSCKQCGCAVLKYTEYGGYYMDQRVRLVDPSLVVES